MGFLYYTFLTLLILVSLLLIGLILIQKGRGGGLSSAFGGGGGSAAFGAKTGDVLTWLTSSFFAVFIILAVALDLVVNSQYGLTAPIGKTSAAITTPVIPAPVTQTPIDTDTTVIPPTPPIGAGSAGAPVLGPNPQGGYSGATTVNPGTLKISPGVAGTPQPVNIDPLAAVAKTPTTAPVNSIDPLAIPSQVTGKPISPLENPAIKDINKVKAATQP